MKQLLLLLPILLLSTIASGDGGMVRASETHGPWTITIFSAPTPFRVGPVDLSLLVQNADTSKTILDAEVNLMLRHASADSLLVAATHDAATNQLLSAALFDLPEPGLWTVDVLVSRGDVNERMQIELVAGPPIPRLLTLWPWLAIPGITALIFVLHQWLVRSRRSHRVNPMEQA
jgi:hypothetical protein